ncbi:MAG: hypothetical protein M1505_02175 [Patescibacteria group bacterium]|nr:hypothetical protein [Patescibacteria group bacterium]MCL5258008.1 hypothetical protein [Patescibacteria group bacterium]
MLSRFKKDKKNFFNIAIIVLIGLFIFNLGSVFAAGVDSLNFNQTGVRCGGSEINIFEQSGGVNLSVRQGLLGKCVIFYLIKILSVAYTVVMLLSVGYLIYIGFRYVSGSGGAENIHKQLIWVIWGVGVAILAFAIVKALEISLTG